MTRRQLAALPLHQRIAWAIETVTDGNQTAFGRKVGTTPNRVNQWARGRSAPGKTYAEKIGELVNMPADLFTKNGSPAITPEDLAAGQMRILAALEEIVSAREGFFAELRDQLGAQTNLLERLTETAEELHGLQRDLRATLDASGGSQPAPHRASRKRGPA